MAKKSKLQTPDWIKEGYESPEDYNKAKGVAKKKTKGRTFKIRCCPKCGSEEVGVVLSNSNSEEDSGTGKEWECRKCEWKGKYVKEEELEEEEFLKRMEEK